MNETKAREGSLQFDVMPVFMALFYFGIIVKKSARLRSGLLANFYPGPGNLAEEYQSNRFFTRN